MAHIYLQVLQLLVLFFFISECRDNSPVPETVSGSQEEHAFLPCFNSSVMDPKTCYRVKWTKQETDSGQMKVILTWPTTNLKDANRVKLEADENSKMSLVLNNLQKSDEGLYTCEIWKGWECILAKNISLKVKDCKSLKAVKAAPSANATLRCPVNITSGQQKPQNISWVILKGTNTVLLSSTRAEIKETSLAIQSVNVRDTGWYRCSYMLGQRQRCFDINLQVQVEDVVMTTMVPVIATKTVQGESTKKEGSKAFTAVVASVITVALISALIGLFICHRCNTQRVTQQTQRRQAVAPMQSSHAYEIVNVRLSEDLSDQRVNSLYQHFQDESMCTFNY